MVLVDLPGKSPVRVGLFEGILNAWVSVLSPEDVFTLQEASEGMRSPPPDPPGDSGPSVSLERLVSLNAPFCLCFLDTSLANF